jgi:hypothetical protein
VRLKPAKRDDGTIWGYAFYCPGCEHGHVFYVTGPMTWEFNGDLESPTFTPSLLNTCEPHPDPKQRRCHLFLTKGVLYFLGDCAHDMRGNIVPLEDHWPDSEKEALEHLTDNSLGLEQT